MQVGGMPYELNENSNPNIVNIKKPDRNRSNSIHKNYITGVASNINESSHFSNEQPSEMFANYDELERHKNEMLTKNFSQKVLSPETF